MRIHRRPPHPPARDPAAIQEPDEAFAQLVLGFIAERARIVPAALLLTVALAGLLLADQAPLSLILVWAGLVAAALALRLRVLPGLASDHATAASRRLHRAALTSLASGFAHGALAWLLFLELDLVGRALVTMVIVGTASGAVAMTAGLPRAFAYYAGAALAPLAVLWLWSPGMPEARLWERAVGVLVLLVGAIQWVAAWHAHRLLREAFEHRLRYAAQLDRAETASRAKSRFLAAVSHDLRQPLHTLTLYISALRTREPDAFSSDILDKMTRATGSLGELLADLLDYSKIDAGAVRANPRPFDLAALAHQVVADYQPLASAQRLALEAHCPPSAWVVGDPLLTRRILANLVDNAIKYTREGRVDVGIWPGPERTLLRVDDTGVGIAPDQQSRIFEEFYQLDSPQREHTRGLGLGLAIVRRLAGLMDYGLTLESAPGAGTRFAVTLPTAAAASVPRRAPAEQVPPPAVPRGLRALVVDDEEAVRNAMAVLLRDWGWEVMLAEDAAVAMARMEHVRPDVLLVDFRMAGGDGIDFIEQVRARHGPQRVLLITGEPLSARLQDARAAGLPVLHKPVSGERLRAAVAELLREDPGDPRTASGPT